MNAKLLGIIVLVAALAGVLVAVVGKALEMDTSVAGAIGGVSGGVVGAMLASNKAKKE